MATNKITKEEKIKRFKAQCRQLEHMAESLVSDDYNIEPVVEMTINK